MCVNIIYVCICLYCVICLILYYRSLLICTNKEFMNVFNKILWDYQSTCIYIKYNYQYPSQQLNMQHVVIMTIEMTLTMKISSTLTV